MKIGLLGGSFNPAHQGHIHISNIALKVRKLDQIWWIPTKYNPLKDPSIYDSYDNRIKICQNITSRYPKIKVKKYEQIRTDLLIKFLKKKYKNAQFYWVMGADNLNNFHKWHNYKALLKSINFIIVSRETFLNKANKNRCWKFFDKKKDVFVYAKKKNISSTEIRKKINN